MSSFQKIDLQHVSLLIISWFILPTGCQSGERSRVYRAHYEADGRYLTVEVLDDDLIHFELTERAPNAEGPSRIYTTPMVFKTDYNGPSVIRDDGDGTLETRDVRVEVNQATLSVAVTDKSGPSDVRLTTLSPLDVEGDKQGLAIARHQMQHAYGLGEQFGAPGEPNGNWVGRLRAPGNEFGNKLVNFEEGAGSVGNAQFPVLYALGPATDGYALFVDHLDAQRWDFVKSDWTMEMRGEALRWYVMTGPNLVDLRRDYMELVGRPPVPPKKMFGLWISEYGYDDWSELDDKLRTLRANRFPVDGFVLDLQWFGGIVSESESTQMGSLTWDTARFPNPAQKIRQLRERHGVGLIAIEESYVGRGLPEHDTLWRWKFLASKGGDDEPVFFSTWWGAGGMLDWTNPVAADYWHDLKRRPLIADGLLGHWTDLGEPEQFDPSARYHGFPDLNKNKHRDVHNIYNFRWAESIHRGYERNKVKRRPFIMSRSGTSGIQRFGAGMWSGDIGSRLSQLAAHFNVQMHMSFSGIDYFGADIGGFKRWSLDGDLDEMYTQWFANGAALDIPVRPHTANTENKHETAPDRVGHLKSNLENIRGRYELTPYLYSLAHRAYLYGDPVMPPLVFYDQGDPAVRDMGDQKLIGRNVLAATVSRYGQAERDVYLPAGGWVNYHTNRWHKSRGQWVRKLPLLIDGTFKLPMFVRAGAILPQMYVDEKTMNVTGERLDGSRRDELIVRVYADSSPSEFTLYEDDGETIEYQSGVLRTTIISQVLSDRRVKVRIDRSRGTYEGALTSRDNVVKLITNSLGGCASVKVNGETLKSFSSRDDFEAADRGWHQVGRHLIVAKSGRLNVKKPKNFVFDFKTK
ncbi:MAG: DUF5110 domain-containing protein [Phycisphaerales bacterium]|nr:DUF5110 domain-containing protein [Phycisphaerales bacterium]